MSILLSGDFHANAAEELKLITKGALVDKYGQEKFDGIKYHVILGDAGFLWPGNEEKEEKYLKKLDERPFPLLCVIGNHEPVLGFSDPPEIDIGLGENVILVKKEKPFIAYLKRGKIYKIENHNCLVLGGALSIDKAYRKPNINWWENEYWSEKEESDLFEILKSQNNFDYVLSHTGPGRINFAINYLNRGIKTGSSMTFIPKFKDKVAVLNDKIDKEIKCAQWFCGHWHKDIYHYDETMKRGYQYLYRTTALLTEEKEIEVL